MDSIFHNVRLYQNHPFQNFFTERLQFTYSNSKHTSFVLLGTDFITHLLFVNEKRKIIS